VVHGPSLMRNYWRNPQATTQATSDGWLRAGDWGYLDPDGYLHVVDRIKEIIVGVSNVAPADLEAVLADSPEIAAAAVVGRPDERLGEVPVAFVVRSTRSELSAEQVLALFDASDPRRQACEESAAGPSDTELTQGCELSEQGVFAAAAGPCRLDADQVVGVQELVS
jgi:acyl-CoA synthetase (AMP-forming)/AMP-acid ligase II